MPWFHKDDAERAAPAQPSPAPKPLKVSALLDDGSILFPPAGTDKTRVLEQLVAVLCGRAGLEKPSEVLAKVLEREQGISTTLDTGLCLPHARLDGIDSLWAGLAVPRPPLLDPRHADLPIRVIYLFFSPNKREMFPLHLQLLRGAATLFQPPLIDALAAASDAAEALAIIRRSEG